MSPSFDIPFNEETMDFFALQPLIPTFMVDAKNKGPAAYSAKEYSSIVADWCGRTEVPDHFMDEAVFEVNNMNTDLLTCNESVAHCALQGVSDACCFSPDILAEPHARCCSPAAESVHQSAVSAAGKKTGASIAGKQVTRVHAAMEWHDDDARCASQWYAAELSTVPGWAESMYTAWWSRRWDMVSLSGPWSYGKRSFKPSLAPIVERHEGITCQSVQATLLCLKVAQSGLMAAARSRHSTW